MAMKEAIIDIVAIGRLAKALAFIAGAAHPTTVALRKAAESEAESDIKKARLLFLQLRPGMRQAAFAMMED
jgi:hypothetical protein